MKVLVLGATGMLGSTLFKYLGSDSDFSVYGTTRQSLSDSPHLKFLGTNLIGDIGFEDWEAFSKFVSRISPNFIVNCVGLVKQLPSGRSPLTAIPLNSMLPHRLADLCQKIGARLIHISTDCVFSGQKGNYKEGDAPDALDVYGRTKMLGEVDYAPGLTLRTSIIGHELGSNRSLIEWFLSQEGPVKGFVKAIYTGLPTIELSRVIKKVILEKPEASGLYHVASAPITKYGLLQIVKEVYGKSTVIEPSEELVIDRSLDASLFNEAFSYSPPTWPDLVKSMFTFQKGMI